jgi:hypothetical protein
MRSKAKQSRTRRECAAKMAFDPTTKFLLLTDNEIARQSADPPKPLKQADPKGNPNGRNRPAKSKTIRPLGYQPCRAGCSAGLPQRVLRSAAPPDLCAVHSVAALLSLSLGVALRRSLAQQHFGSAVVFIPGSAAHFTESNAHEVQQCAIPVRLPALSCLARVSE